MKRDAQAGFSLLELLVALFVVMIIASLVTLNVDSGGREIELESRLRSLADISAYAIDEAQMSGRDMGLLLERVSLDGEPRYRYSYREHLPEGWRRPEQDQALYEERDLPAGIALQLVLDDVTVSELDQDSDALDTLPQIVFYASGETTPGYIELRAEADGQLLWLVEWDLLGRFTLLPRGEEAPEDEADE